MIATLLPQPARARDEVERAVAEHGRGVVGGALRRARRDRPARRQLVAGDAAAGRALLVGGEVAVQVARLEPGGAARAPITTVRCAPVFRLTSRTDFVRASNSPRWKSSQSPLRAPPHSQLPVLTPRAAGSRCFGCELPQLEVGAEPAVGERTGAGRPRGRRRGPATGRSGPSSRSACAGRRTARTRPGPRPSTTPSRGRRSPAGTPSAPPSPRRATARAAAARRPWSRPGSAPQRTVAVRYSSVGARLASAGDGVVERERAGERRRAAGVRRQRDGGARGDVVGAGGEPRGGGHPDAQRQLRGGALPDGDGGGASRSAPAAA